MESARENKRIGPATLPKPKQNICHNNNNNNNIPNNNGVSKGEFSEIDYENARNGNSRLLSTDEERVVMTPKGKTSNSTVILIERKIVDSITDRQHVAGGDHSGIIVNKDISRGQKSQETHPNLSLEFRVFLVSENTGHHSQESRTLRFWFRPWITDDERQAYVAQDFFRELVRPKEFPRDYVGFIKRLMKMLQKGYNDIQALEVELRLLEPTSAPPSRPLSFEDSHIEIVQLSTEKVLELIEQAYPNPVTPEDLAKDYGWSEVEVLKIILLLKERGIIKALDANSFTRVHHEENEIKIVKQMPTIASHKQPTIAIITAQYSEKLAVDAMLENKETFVRYTSIGESNVYTLGNIGAHRIVSTKLPSVGSSREAMIATGSTTTRLLGTFQKVDYVFIVGVAGGVPHLTDYNKHVRLGDVVISCAKQNKMINEKNFVYVFNNGEENKLYYPKNACLQEISMKLKNVAPENRPWQMYFNEGRQHLQERTEVNFNKPSANSDKLYMNIGNGEVIEVQHPRPGDDVEVSTTEIRLHLGPIGSGRDTVKSEGERIKFAREHNLLATDIEMSPVLDSIIGNCRDSFVLIKGISDYKDGMTTRKWQNYAALSAAAVMKSVICGMDAPTNV